MKKLKDSQIRGIEEARQRLVELEKKHAKALKELQRAEKTRVKTSSRRRRTFHGYPTSDGGIIHKVVKEVSESSIVTPDQPQDQIISDVFKLHPEGQGKGFPHDKLASPRLAESSHQARSQSICEVITTTGDCRNTAKDASENRSDATDTPHLRPSVAESAKHKKKESDKNGCCSATDKMEDGNKAVNKGREEKKRKKIHTDGGLPKVWGLSGSCTKKIALNGRISTDIQKTESFLQDQNDVGLAPSTNNVPYEQSKKMLSSDGDPLSGGAVDEKAQQADECVQNEKDDGKQKVDVSLSVDSSSGFEVRCPDSGGEALQEPSVSQDNSQKSVSSHRKKDGWRHLFEEELPRRSSRLKSKERHEIIVLGGQPSNTSRTHQKNRSTTSTTSSSPKENINCSFPRPPVKLTKSGGPLSVIADFSLPDIEFAKLKLNKIRSISTNVYVRDQHLISSQKSKIDSKKGGLPVQQEPDDSNLYLSSSRARSAVHSVRESLNGVSSGRTEGCFIPKILELPQSPGPELMSGELVQEKEIKSPMLNIDHPVGLVDQQPLQGNATGNDLQSCNPNNRHVLVVDGDCGHEPNAEGSPDQMEVLDVNAHPNCRSTFQHSVSDVSKRSLSEGLPAEARSDGNCALKATKPITEPGCSREHVVCHSDEKNTQSTRVPSSLKLQERSQSVSDVEQRVTSDELPLTGDRNPPLSCNETEPKPLKHFSSLGHPLNSSTVLTLSTHPELDEGHHEVAPPVWVEASCSHAGGSSAVAAWKQPGKKDGTVSSLVIMHNLVQEGEVNFIEAVAISKQEHMRVTDESISLKQQSQIANASTVLIQPCVQESEDNLVKQQSQKDTHVSIALRQPCVQGSEDDLLKQQSQNANAATELRQPCEQESEDNLIKQQNQKDTNVSTVLRQPCVKDEGNSTNSSGLSKQQTQSEMNETSLMQPGGLEASSNTEDCPGNLKERGDAAVSLKSESSETFVPVLMQACLDHATEGADNAIRAVALSTYQCSSCHEIQVEKMEVAAVCQAHVLVIWTAMPGQEWTVQHKWTLAADGSEEFCSVQFVSSTSHLIVLTGGVFSTGNGRIYGCTEEAKYCMDLHVEQNMVTDHFSFAAMCILNENVETATKEEADVELVLGTKATTCLLVTKWTLDSLCLIIKKSESLPVVDGQAGLSSLLAVSGNSCLLLGTAGDMVMLWNHKSSELLRSISCRSVSLDNMTCLSALTQMGLLFLTMFSCPSAESKNSTDCVLLAVNPKTDKIVCLDNIAVEKECSCTAAAACGQFVAMGQQQGDACLWNISSNQHDVQLSISKDAVSSIGFHQERPRVAFGSQTGCVHIFSLC